MAFPPPYEAGQQSRRFYDGGVIPDAAAAVTTGTDLGEHCVGLYIGVGGDVSVYFNTDPNGATPVLFKAVPQGAILPGRFRSVDAAATTATNIVALLYL